MPKKRKWSPFCIKHVIKFKRRLLSYLLVWITDAFIVCLHITLPLFMFFELLIKYKYMCFHSYEFIIKRQRLWRRKFNVAVQPVSDHTGSQHGSQPEGRDRAWTWTFQLCVITDSGSGKMGALEQLYILSADLWGLRIVRECNVEEDD